MPWMANVKAGRLRALSALCIGAALSMLAACGGGAGSSPAAPQAVAASTMRVHCKRPDGAYANIAVDPAKGKLDFLLNKGTTSADTVKDGDCDRVASFSADIASKGQEIWLKAGVGGTDPCAPAAGVRHRERRRAELRHAA